MLLASYVYEKIDRPKLDCDLVAGFRNDEEAIVPLGRP